MSASLAVTGTGLGRPAGRLCLLAASLTLVLLPLGHVTTASADPGTECAGADSLLPATRPPVPARSALPPPRTANDRVLADIRRQLARIDAWIVAERVAENARSGDHGPALPGDTSLTGPGPAPALAVTAGDPLEHAVAGQVQDSSDVVAVVPAGDRQRPATSPD